MKCIEPRPYAEAEAAAARLIEIAKSLRVDEGRVSVGKWNAAFIWDDKANAAEYAAGRDHLIATGVIRMHECGGFIMGPPVRRRTEWNDREAPSRRHMSSKRIGPRKEP